MNKLFRQTHDPIWHIQLAILIVIVLQLATNSLLLPYNKYILITLELVLLFILAVVSPNGYERVSSPRRSIAIGLIAVITIINALSLLLLLNALFYGNILSSRDLLLNSIVIYLTNIIMYALWYWEIDGGGPDNRVRHKLTKSDFAFPQTIRPTLSKQGWLPGFIDYLYLSSTNVVNFASSDTIPLTHRAKLLMMTQSFIAVITIALVIARAINSLP